MGLDDGGRNVGDHRRAVAGLKSDLYKRERAAGPIADNDGDAMPGAEAQAVAGQELAWTVEDDRCGLRVVYVNSHLGLSTRDRCR